MKINPKVAALVAVAVLAVLVPTIGGAGPTATPCVWQIESGESLTKISDQLGVDWRDLHEENVDVIGSDANLILVGDLIDSCVGENPEIDEQVEAVFADGPFLPDWAVPPSGVTFPTFESSIDEVKEYGRWKAETEYGWSGDEWAALENLWMRESEWKWWADNPNSTAYGIPQFVRSTATNLMGMNHPDGNGVTPTPVEQIDEGLRYIKLSYGSPSSALRFWLARVKINGKDVGHWY